MKLLLSLLSCCLLSLGSAGHAAHAAPKSDPRKPAAETERKAQADAEFNRAIEAFNAWCANLEKAHQDAPRDAQLILRVAHCRQLRGELAKAQDLLQQARATLGAQMMDKAQVIADAEIGEVAASPDETEVLWNQACEHFEASLQLDTSVTTQLAVTACHLRRGRFQLARALVTEAIAALTPQAATDKFRATQLALGQSLAREIDRLQPRVQVKAPAGFRGAVQVGGAAASLTEPVLLDPGTHEVRATLSDGASATGSLQAAPTQLVRVTISEPAPVLSSRRRLLFWGLVGTGAAAAMTSGITYVSAQSKWHELADLGCARSSRLGGGVTCPAVVSEGKATSYNRTLNIFQASAAGSLLLLSGALIVYVTAPKREHLQIAPAVSGDAAGVTAWARF